MTTTTEYEHDLEEHADPELDAGDDAELEPAAAHDDRESLDDTAPRAEPMAERDDAVGDPDLPEQPTHVASVDPLPTTPDAITGIIRGLATTIPAKGTLILAIARTAEDKVLVTIVPAKGEKETDSAIPLVVRGTPDEIDTQLVEALQHYVPARHIAVRTASEIARDTATAAKKAQDAAKSRPSTATALKKKTPSLTIRVQPKDANLRVTDGADKIQTIKAGVKSDVASGRYIITVTKLGYKTRIHPVVVRDGPEVVDITLEESEQMALLGGKLK